MLIEHPPLACRGVVLGPKSCTARGIEKVGALGRAAYPGTSDQFVHFLEKFLVTYHPSQARTSALQQGHQRVREEN